MSGDLEEKILSLVILVGCSSQFDPDMHSELYWGTVFPVWSHSFVPFKIVAVGKDCVY